MNREWWTALVDAVVLAVSLIVQQFVAAEWADLIVKIVIAFQPVVLGYVLAVYAERIKVEVRGLVDHAVEELRGPLR